MKKIGLLILTLLMSYALTAQSQKMKDLLKIEEDTYFADRDSAYADPYYGIKKLVYGNKRFVDNRRVSPRQSDQDLKDASLGQKPFATIIGCADSRVPNEMIFDQGVGDLFITRTAGQVMAEASYGTIEYATVALDTKLIVVLGHESCGAVTAAMKLPENPPGHVVTLINSIKPASVKAMKEGTTEKEQLDITVRANVIEQVNLLRNLEPVLSRKFEKGETLIIGAVYKLSTGQVEFIEETIFSLPKFADEMADSGKKKNRKG